MVSKVNPDKGTSIFWLLFGLFVMEESYRLDLGELRKPDSGLFPFFIGAVITGLSFIFLVQSLGGESSRKEKRKKVSYRNILLTVIFLYAYALVFEWLGFIPSTFLLLSFLVRFIEHKGWVTVITIALLTSIASYVMFEVWLQASLPKGIFGI